MLKLFMTQQKGNYSSTSDFLLQKIAGVEEFKKIQTQVNGAEKDGWRHKEQNAVCKELKNGSNI